MVWYTCFWILRSRVQISGNHFPSPSSNYSTDLKPGILKRKKVLLFLTILKNLKVGQWIGFLCIASRRLQSHCKTNSIRNFTTENFEVRNPILLNIFEILRTKWANYIFISVLKYRKERQFHWDLNLQSQAFQLSVLPPSHQAHDKIVKVWHTYFVRLLFQQSLVFLQKDT